MGSSSSKPTIEAPPPISSESVGSAPSPPQPEDDPEESKCPMSRGDGTYSYDWRAFLKLGGKHPKVSKETLEASQQLQPLTEEASSGCPVKHSGSRQEYNVYGQKINPDNNMPSNPNQLPNSLQNELLSTDRERSTIPKGGTSDDKTWTYPSAQMFYNALSRKGKLNDTNPQDVPHVVAVHNQMNEQTWHKILQWEAAIHGTDVRLLKFEGRPHDLSPKATLKHYLLGHPLPFDRHDWMVERGDGTVVRYVLDYYYDDEGDTSLLVDVRPAADTMDNIYQRVRMHFNDTSDFVPLPLSPSPTLQSQVGDSLHVWQQIQQGKAQDTGSNGATIPTLSEQEALELTRQMKLATKQCRSAKAALEACSDDAGCQKASLDWILCNGKYICQIQHQTLTQQLHSKDGDVDHALERLHDCVNLKTKQYTDLQK